MKQKDEYVYVIIKEPIYYGEDTEVLGVMTNSDKARQFCQANSRLKICPYIPNKLKEAQGVVQKR